MRFLIVDDDPDILKITEKLVKLQGHDVETCGSAMAAINLLNQGGIDILITDATMPAHSGFDLIRTLKRKKDYGPLTIAMLTGRKEREDIVQAAELGVQDYIVKPIEPDVFMEKVNKLADRHHKVLANQPKRKQITMSVPVDVHEMTDMGISIRGPYPMAKGTIVAIDIPELKEHGIEQERFRVIFSSTGTGTVITELLLLDLTEKQQQILSKLAKKWNKKAA